MPKQCFKCKQVKSLGEFYKHPAMGDGRLGKCKECAKADVTANREKNLEYYRAYDIDRGRTSKRRNMNARITKKYNRDYPQRYIAGYSIRNAVRDGRLFKPETCEHCGANRKLHAHHEDYLKPLDVMWLCVPCHKRHHLSTA